MLRSCRTGSAAAEHSRPAARPEKVMSKLWRAAGQGQLGGFCCRWFVWGPLAVVEEKSLQNKKISLERNLLQELIETIKLFFF